MKSVGLSTNNSSYQQIFEKITKSLVCLGIPIKFVTINKMFNQQLITNIMNKSELIDAIAADAGITKAAAKLALESFLGNVSGTLKKGGRVSLVGFGSWSVSKRAARDGRNPQTGKTIKIAAKNVVKFKAGAELDGAVN
jgi:DNA-binding protein HU-beta